MWCFFGGWSVSITWTKKFDGHFLQSVSFVLNDFLYFFKHLWALIWKTFFKRSTEGTFTKKLQKEKLKINIEKKYYRYKMFGMHDLDLEKKWNSKKSPCTKILQTIVFLPMHYTNSGFYSKHMKWTLGNFYIYINLGGLFASIITPVLRNSHGGESFTVVFAVGASTFFSASGNFSVY